MTRELGCTPVRSRVVFEAAASLLLALAVPLVITTAVEASTPTGVAVLVLVLGTLVALGSHCAVVATRAVVIRTPRSADRHLGRSGDATDPLHHPLRPRAPGLA